MEAIWRLETGSGPLVATAIHDGHEVRDEVAALLELAPDDRRREEDPYTAAWTACAPTRVVGLRSRFEVDLNRPRDQAVYLRPEDAWGLRVWAEEPDAALVERSLAEYDAFYAAMRAQLARIEREHGAFVVFDIHSYNHRRAGPDAPAADPGANPQVNVGTATVDRSRWGALVDRFVRDLREQDVPGGRLDVRENVKFLGGHWPRWIHSEFPQTGVAIAIEVKKFFMDEWTGRPDSACVEAVGEALRATADGVLEEFGRVSAQIGCEGTDRMSGIPSPGGE